MAAVNRCTFIGNLGQDIDLKYSSSGDAIANFSIAVNETWKAKDTGEKQEHTEWVKVVMFGKTAEVASKFLSKGSSVYIEGKLQTRKWQDKTGQDRYTTEIRADTMQMLGSPGERSGAPTEALSAPITKGSARPQAKSTRSFADVDEDIAF